MSAPVWSWYTLEPPARRQAGTTGEGRVPFYFDCAGDNCPSPDGALIAAFLGTGPTFREIALIRPREEGRAFPVKVAMYCTSCARALGVPVDSSPETKESGVTV